MSEPIAWYENPDLWDWGYDFMFGAERWEQAALDVPALEALLQLSPPAKILDLCCGPGRFSIPLAARGYTVTGVDRTPYLLDKLTSRAEAEHLDINIIVSDMRDFVHPEHFDVALSMYTSFGYFEDPADDRKVLDNIYRSLAPGGVLLMDFLGRDGIITHFQRRDWREVNGAYLLEDREFIEDCARMKNRWTIVRDGKIMETGFVLRVYGAAELTRLIRETGFVNVRTHADLTGNPFTHRSPRLIIVAEKEQTPVF